MNRFSKWMMITACIYNCYANNPDYYSGYINAVLEDFSLANKSSVLLEGSKLTIKIHSKIQPLSFQKKLKERLNKSQYFKTVILIYTNPQTKQGNTVLDNKKIIPQDVPSDIIPTNIPANMEFLPSRTLYDAPLADPKWPAFCAGYQRHYDKIYGKHLFALSFGDNLALFRHHKDNMSYEWGIQAGLSGLMDFSKAPSKLINSDYFVGGGLSIVYDKHWQNMFQFSHLSAHLGDELLLSSQKLAATRLNLSYEAFKWYTAYKFESFRPYVGIGYMVNCDPSYLKPLILEAGIDYVSPDAFLMKTGRFVWGIHTHCWQTNGFKPSLNIRPGVQFENPNGNGRHLRFSLDYSNGKSRHGQFYTKTEHYIGILVSITS